MLQFTQKQGRVKRKALLVNTKGGLEFETLKYDIPVDEPQPLPGDAFERMRADPELMAIKKRLALSAAVVLGLVAVATIIHWNYENWFPQATSTIPMPVADDAPVVSSTSVARQTRIASAPRPEKKPTRLDFTAPDRPEEPRITSAPSVANPASQAAPQLGARYPIPGANSNRVPAISPADRAPATLGGRFGDGVISGLPRALFRVTTKSTPMVADHDVGKAKAALIGFLKASNVNQRLQFVCDRAVVEPRMRTYYEKRGDGPVGFERIADSAVVGNGSTSEHDIMLAGGWMHRATVIKGIDGSYLVDWPSFVLESEMDWLEFMEKKPTRPVLFRVTAETGNFFGSDFSDPKWLMCIKLQNPANPDAPAIYAYVERQSVLGRETEYWMRLSEGQAMPMTIRLRFPPVATLSNQAWLTDLVAVGWVVRESRPVVEARR